MAYIATFHTHLGAMTFCNTLQSLGDRNAVMMPVPRALSASCGTCVRFEEKFDADRMYDEDLDQVFEQKESGFQMIFRNADG